MRRTDLIGTFVFALALVAWDASGADLWLTSRFGTAAGFAWRSSWWTESLIHEGGRWLAAAMLVMLVVNVVAPWRFAARLTRAQRAGWLAVTIACLLLIPLIKRYSLTSCPWDLQWYGGSAHWVSHWALGVADSGPGHCFPSGHASSAFAFICGFFALRERHPRAARWWLAMVSVLGLIYGAGQLMRGAHFASHTAWTAWICWTTSAAVFAAAPRIRVRTVGPALPGQAA